MLVGIINCFSVYMRDGASGRPPKAVVSSDSKVVGRTVREITYCCSSSVRESLLGDRQRISGGLKFPTPFVLSDITTALPSFAIRRP